MKNLVEELRMALIQRGPWSEWGAREDRVRFHGYIRGLIAAIRLSRFRPKTIYDFLDLAKKLEISGCYGPPHHLEKSHSLQLLHVSDPVCAMVTIKRTDLGDLLKIGWAVAQAMGKRDG